MPDLWHKRQKARGSRLVLSWFPPRQCWKKYRNGKTKYFKHPNSAEGYEAAVVEYHAWLHQQKQTRPNAAEYEHHIRLLQQCSGWYDRFGVPEDEEDMSAILTELLDRMESAFENEEPLPRVESWLPDGVTLAEKQFIFTFCDEGILGPDEVSNVFNERFGSVGWSPTGDWKDANDNLVHWKPITASCHRPSSIK